MILTVHGDDSPVSDFEQYLLKSVIQNEKPQEGQLQRISRICCEILALALGYSSTYPFVLASLKYPNVVIAGFSVAGSIAASGTFAAHNLRKFVKIQLQRQSHEERQLYTHYMPVVLRVANVTLAVFAGMFTGFPSIEIAMAFSHNKIVGTIISIITIIGGSGPTTYSMYRGILAVENASFNLWHRYAQEPNISRCYRYKEFLLTQLKEKLHYGLALSYAQRRLEFNAMYLSAFQQAHFEPLEQIRLLSQELFQELPAQKRQKIETSKWVSLPSMLLQGVGTVLAGAFLMENGLLARDSAKEFTQEESLIALFIAGSLLPWLWAGIKIPGHALAKIYQQLTDLMGLPREKTFIEERFFWMDKLMHGISLLIAFFPFGEIVEIAQQYYDWEKWTGKVLLTSSAVTLTLLFSHAVNSLLSEVIEYYTARHGYNQELREALDFKNRISALITVLEQIHPKDLSSWIEKYKHDPFVRHMMANCESDDDFKQHLLSSEAS